MLFVPRRAPVDLSETNKKPNFDERREFITDDCVYPVRLNFAKGFVKIISALRANLSFVRFCSCPAVLTIY